MRKRRAATQEERDKARALRATGLSYRTIGRELNRCHHVVQEWCDDKFVARRKVRSRRHYLRACARDEAAKTGEPVDFIYARWGVA